MNKTKRIDLRLTEQEYSQLYERAKNYKNMSAFLIDAGLRFEDRTTIRKIEVMDKFSEVYIALEADVNRAGKNINQIAHYCNLMKLQNIATNEEILSEIEKLYMEWLIQLMEITQMQKRILSIVMPKRHKWLNGDI